MLRVHSLPLEARRASRMPVFSGGGEDIRPIHFPFYCSTPVAKALEGSRLKGLVITALWSPLREGPLQREESTPAPCLFFPLIP
jgi:hypothetical protein